MARKKDFAAMEQGRPSGDSAARAAMRSRMAHPTSLRLDEVQPNPRNPRYTDDDPQIHELAATLHRVGQLQPALVITREQYATAYPDEEMLGPQPWVVIVGNRRLAAARVARRAAIDVRVTIDLSDAAAIEDRVLIENIHRKDLPPLLEAELLQHRLDQPGQTLRSVAAAIEKTHTYVAQRLALLTLIPELQRMLREGQISIRNGRELGARAADQQRAILVHIATMSEEETRTFLAGAVGNPVSNAGFVNRVSNAGVAGAGAVGEPGNGATVVNPVSKTGAGVVGAGAGAGAGAVGESGNGATVVNPVSKTGAGVVGAGAGAVGESGNGATVVNPVSKTGAPGAGRRLVNPVSNAGLEAARLTVAQWLDNAAADLDRVLPAGGEAGTGQKLTEARRLIEEARALLR